MSVESNSPRLSIIVLVYRDWDRLRLCLNVLAAQTLPTADIEIIAINKDHALAPEGFAHPRLTLLRQAL